MVRNEYKVAETSTSILYRCYPQNTLAGRQDNVNGRGGQDKTPSPLGGVDDISSEEEEPQDQRVWDNIRTMQDSQSKLTGHISDITTLCAIMKQAQHDNREREERGHQSS